MIDIGTFILIQFLIIIFSISAYLIYNLYRKNKKLEDIINKQDTYINDMYEALKYTEERIKEIDTHGIFQGDDEVGFFFKTIKEVQKNLSDYIKFIK